MTEHLQINDVAPIVHYVGDGVQAAFTFPFAVFKADDLEVWVDTARIAGGYTVSGAGISTGGSVLFTVPPVQGAIVTLRRRVTLARVTDFQSDGIIRAKTLNDELDYQVAAVQQVAEDVARCVRRRFTSASTADLTLPEPVGHRALKWNAAGDALVNSDHDPDTAVLSAQQAAASAATAQGHADVAGLHSAAAGISATDAAASAASAAALVAGVTLPHAAGHGLAYLRQKGAEDGFEYRTPAQVLADIGGQSAADVQAQMAVLDSGIRTIRDQGVLTALRQMLNTGVGSGALVRGREWELSTDEWGATSTGKSYVAGTIAYYTQAIGADTVYASGSGDYVVPAGVSNLLVKVWGGGGSARRPAGSWFGSGGAGGGFTMANLAVTPGQSLGYSVGAGGSGDGTAGGPSTFGALTAGGGAGGVQATHSGAQPLPVGGVGGTENGEAGHCDSPYDGTNLRRGGNAGGMAHGGGAGGGNASGNPSSGYDGVAPGGGGGGASSGGYGGVGAAGRVVVTPVYAMTLAVPAAVTVNSAPSVVDLFFLWKDDSGGGLTAPLATVRLSRDGGVTKSVAALTVLAAFDGTYSIIRARADVSGQPSAASLWADLDFGTVKQRFAAPALLGE